MSDDQKTELEAQREAAEKEAKLDNDTRTGKGTRSMVSQTRGKGTMVIKFENFDKSQPDTLPKTVQEFTTLVNAEGEDELVGYLIDGYNEAQYTAASDPIAEFVDPSWPAEAKLSFKLVVRNYYKNTGTSVEDAVALIKPGFAKQYAAKEVAAV